MNKPHSEITKKILLFLLVSGVLLVASPTTPKAATALWKAVFKGIRSGKKDAAYVHRLVKAKYIAVIHTKNGVKLELTKRGKYIAQNIKDGNRDKPPSWDGVWHVVMYDIPSKHKHERDMFRAKVKELGMYQLQKSVWVYPYDCKEEIQFLCDILSVSYKKHILYFETKEIPEMNELKNIFGIKETK